MSMMVTFCYILVYSDIVHDGYNVFHSRGVSHCEHVGSQEGSNWPTCDKEEQISLCVLIQQLQLRLIYINWRKNIPRWLHVKCEWK